MHPAGGTDRTGWKVRGDRTTAPPSIRTAGASSIAFFNLDFFIKTVAVFRVRRTTLGRCSMRGGGCGFLTYRVHTDEHKNCNATSELIGSFFIGPRVPKFTTATIAIRTAFEPSTFLQYSVNHLRGKKKEKRTERKATHAQDARVSFHFLRLYFCFDLNFFTPCFGIWDLSFGWTLTLFPPL